MSSISSNLPTPPLASGTQENEIAQKKASTPTPIAQNNSQGKVQIKNNDRSNESGSNNSSHLSTEGTPSPETSATSSFSEAQGGVSAEATSDVPLQDTTSPFINATLLPKSATDYISKTIGAKVASASITLKMEPTKRGAVTTPEVVIVNDNGAPSLLEPISKPGYSTSGTTSGDDDPLSSTPEQPQDTFNVFKIVEESAQFSVNSQLQAISASVAGADADENIQQSAITSENAKENQAVADAENSRNEQSNSNKTSNACSGVGWAINSLTMAAGIALCATGVGAGLGAALIVGATASMIMASPAGKMALSDMATSLEGPPCHASQESAEIGAQCIGIGMVLGPSCIAGAAGPALSAACQAASVAATSGTEIATVTTSSVVTDTTTDATTEATSQVANTTRSSTPSLATDNADDAPDPEEADAGYDAANVTSRSPVTAEDMVLADAMSSSSQYAGVRALNAFGTSLARSSAMAMRSLGTVSLAELPSLALSKMSTAVSDAATFPMRLASDVIDFFTSVFSGITQFIKESFMTLSMIRSVEEASALVLASSKELSASQRIAELAKTLYNVLPRTVPNGIFTALSVTNNALNIYQAWIQEQALIATGQFTEIQGDLKIDQAFFNEMQSFIENSNTAIGNMLDIVNNEIGQAEATIGEMNSPLRSDLLS